VTLVQYTHTPTVYRTTQSTQTIHGTTQLTRTTLLTIVESGRPQMTLFRMRIACWTPKVTNTHSQM